MSYQNSLRRILQAEQYIKIIATFLLSIVIIIFSLYAYLNARNIDKYGDIVLVILFFLSLPRLLTYKVLNLSKTIVICFGCFLGLILASVLFPPSDYASAGWLTRSLFRLLLAIGVVFSCYRMEASQKRFFYIFLCLLSLFLFGYSILSEYGILHKAALSSITPLEIVNNHLWNEKYYAFWFVFLMWASVACLWRRGKFSTAAAVLLLILGSWSVFLTTSESAKLAVIVGLLVFVLCHSPLMENRSRIYLLLFFLFVLPPLCWLMMAPVASIIQDSYKVGNFVNSIGGLSSRIPFYDVASEMIRREPFSGYGFGSARDLPAPSGVFASGNTLPGGHPHNIVFLFFLEQGVFGFLWFVTALFIFFKFIYKYARHIPGEPAIWALLISGQVIFSLSFDMWQADVVMIYCMFFLLINIGLQVDGEVESDTNDNYLANFFMVFITLSGIIYYVINFLYENNFSNA